MKITDTESELKKVEDRIKTLQLKSDTLRKTTDGFNSQDRFLAKEEQKIFSDEKTEEKNKWNPQLYNKRLGYATVYDNPFKSIVKETASKEEERPSTLSKAGTNLLSQNPSLSVYKHRELIGASPFGASVGTSSYSKKTSSSAYGNFFRK